MNTITLAQFDKLKTIPDIRLALFGDDQYTELSESEDCEHGQVKRITVTKNLLTDEIVETQTVDWTYDKDGCVDEITTSKKDVADKAIGGTVVVKHYPDGKQPTVSTESAIVPVVIER